MDESTTESGTRSPTRADSDDGFSRTDATFVEEPPSSEEEDDVEGPETSRLSAEMRAHIVDTYRECWRQFYEYEQHKCLQDLLSLASPTHDASSLCDDPEYAWLDDLVMQDSSGDGTVSWSAFVFRDSSGACSPIPADHWQAEPFFPEPGPRYFSCAPTSSYIECDSLELRFIRFGGVQNSSFDERAYMRLFRSIAWQSRTQDPDFGLINFETIMRLSVLSDNEIQILSAARIFLDDIVEAEILTEWMNKTSSADPDMSSLLDAIYSTRQRDHWPWLGCRFPIDSEIAQTYKPAQRVSEDDNPLSSLDSIAMQFCPFLECVKASCETHMYATGWRSRDAALPHVSSEQLLHCGKHPCNNQCYLTTSAIPGHIVLLEQQTLDFILAVEPDALPCVVAHLLQNVTCVQVYTYRCKKLPPEYLQPPTRKGKVPTIWADFSDGMNINEITPLAACHCSGPCNSLGTSCECYQKGFHCRRNCQCSVTCALRYKGCGHTCKNGHCISKCPCKIHGWECNFERCHGGYAYKHRLRCQNLDMQQHKVPSIEIKNGLYGFGAFAKSSIAANTYLGDYTAGLFGNRRLMIAQNMIGKAASLNYSFTLNPEQELDALDMGNETRFPNDPRDICSPNVYALPKYIDGNHHMTYYTAKSVQQGEELLLNYGENYWKDIPP